MQGKDLKKISLEIIEKLEIIRTHRKEEQGILSKLMDDELLDTIDKLAMLLARIYIKDN